VAGEDASIAVVDSTYWNLCSGIHWHAAEAEFTTLELESQDFVLRSAVVNDFCWE
jgi:hypothetical protein